jgi:hypothetical protein
VNMCIWWSHRIARSCKSSNSSDATRKSGGAKSVAVFDAWHQKLVSQWQPGRPKSAWPFLLAAQDKENGASDRRDRTSLSAMAFVRPYRGIAASGHAEKEADLLASSRWPISR